MYVEIVEKFMDACGQTVDKLDEDQAKLYMNLCKEEYKEYVDATNDVERLDACIDLAWVATGAMISLNFDRNSFIKNSLALLKKDTIGHILDMPTTIFDDYKSIENLTSIIVASMGTAVTYGWDFKGGFEEVARSNMAKVDPVTGKVIKREDGKILKPEGWTPPDLTSFI